MDGLGEDAPAAVEINAAYPAAEGNTLDNLKAAAAGENEEWTTLYADFDKVAAEEGFPEVAMAFKMISKVEEKHEARYLKLADNIEKGMVFKKDGKVKWKCRNCGYIHEGDTAPGICPACLHKQEYYEVFVENY